MKKALIFIFIIGLFLSFQVPAFAQEERSIDQKIEVLELKLEIVRLKKGIWLERVKQAMPLQFRVEEAKLVDEIAKLNAKKTIEAEEKKKQEADKKAEEGKE